MLQSNTWEDKRVLIGPRVLALIWAWVGLTKICSCSNVVVLQPKTMVSPTTVLGRLKGTWFDTSITYYVLVLMFLSYSPKPWCLQPQSWEDKKARALIWVTCCALCCLVLGSMPMWYADMQQGKLHYVMRRERYALWWRRKMRYVRAHSQIPVHLACLPCVIAERAIHLSYSNGWVEFWPEPMKFLVEMLNHAHRLRIHNNFS